MDAGDTLTFTYSEADAPRLAPDRLGRQRDSRPVRVNNAGANDTLEVYDAREHDQGQPDLGADGAAAGRRERQRHLSAHDAASRQRASS